MRALNWRVRVQGIPVLLMLLQVTQAPFARIAYASDSSDMGSEGQKANYLKAATTADSAAETNTLLTKVWAGVAGVCVAACASTYLSTVGANYGDYVCMATNLGGGITDAVKTQEYMGLASTVVGMGVSYAMKSSATKAATTAAENGTKSTGNMSSCLSGAVAGVQAFTKNQAAQQAEASAKQNRDAAAALVTSDTNAPVAIYSPPAPDDPLNINPNLNNTNPNPLNGRPTAVRTNSPNSAAPGSNNSGSNSPTGGGLALIPHQDAALSGGVAYNDNKSCSGTDPQSQLQCAVASDRNLPAFVKDPRFQKELEKLTGTSLSNFLKTPATPAQALGSTLAGGADATQRAKLDEALNALASKFGDSNGPAYAGGGGGGGAAAGGEDPGLAALMAGLTNQLGGEKEGAPNGGDLLKFGESLAGDRSPSSAGSEEDRTLNIFFRVTQRYRVVAKRMILKPATAPLQVTR